MAPPQTSTDPHQQRRRARAQRRRQTDPEYREQGNLRRRLSKFGLTVEDYEAMLENQRGLCKICGCGENSVREGSPLPLCVDHDEETGKVRGLLCSNCNVGIGMLKHNPELLHNAITYLGGSLDGTN